MRAVRLSFVIPAFNEEAALPGCVESIRQELARTPVEAEIIVVNNASSDRTRAVALGLPDVRLVDEPRKGLTHARQAGFAASTGQLIANIDADNRLPVGWIRTVLDTFDHQVGLAALSGPCDYIDLSPFMRGAVKFCYYSLGFAAYRLQRLVLGKGMMLQGGNFVVRRSALEAIGGFNLAYSFYGEDTELGTRLQQAGEVRFTFKLPIHSSARRLQAEGILTMAARYGLNYFWTTVLHRPFTTGDVPAIRLEQGTVHYRATKRRRWAIAAAGALLLLTLAGAGLVAYRAYGAGLGAVFRSG